VANGPLWCYFYALRFLEKSCPDMSRRFFCSQPDNNAVVYGTEECLLAILQKIKQNFQPSVLLIENSCSIGLIGDDLAGIAQQAGMTCPVVCMDSGGLKGGFWEGYRAAAKAYFAAVPLKRREVVQPRTVNLLGCTVGYYNAANDLRELKRMLNLAGYQITACPGAGSTAAEIDSMNQAELNLVIHSELGCELAKQLQQEYGVPYLSLLPPYGLEGSLNWLRTLGERMWMENKSMQAVEQEAGDLEQRFRAAVLDMQLTWGEPWFENTLIAGPSSVALGIARALRREWMDTGSLTIVLQDGEAADSLPERPDIVLNGQKDGKAIQKQLAELSSGLLLGSSQEKALVQQQGIPNVVCQNIALPVYDEVILSDRPFMGLRGACHMLERLWNQYIDFCQRSR
ncbi:MAG: nitrogenase component 1, partial [Veillonellales bacterium]